MGQRLTVCVLVCLGTWSMTPSAQVPEGRVWPSSFDVASVKENESDGTSWSSYWSPGRLTIKNMPLRRILAHAYDVALERFAIAGINSKVLDRRFDIQATTPGDVPEDQIRPMIRNLLVERFHLRLHWEDRKTPIYALSLVRHGQFGPELRRSSHHCTALQAQLGQKKEPLTDANRPRDAKRRPLCWPERGDQPPPPGVRVRRNAGPIADLIADVQPYVDRPLLDAAGLQGNFEWQITISRVPSDVEDVPQSMEVALIRQLGLRLQARSATLKVLIIDSVEMPTPN